MDLGIEGKVALVTGGTRGIGLAIARRFLAEGAKVAICGRDEARLHAARAELEKGGEVVAIRCDTADAEQRERFVADAASALGSIDILVNNAGTHVRGNLETMREEDLQRQLNDKLFGFFGMIREVLPHMRRAGDGRIVNIIGQATRHPHPDRMPSGIANAAAQAMTKSVADAVARDNVRVNSVCPQYVETDIITATLSKEMRERGIDRATAASGFTRANVLGRLGQPDEIADLVAFIVSDRANFVTGSSVSIDGGYNRYVFG
ncbi:NAD(P)-dependent dehydrogenase (short-subunit alcohol dehydrogenase family) [Rhodoligotrophos appendicifer]|uniref:SDR family NAD(P)-dependent oxidoreductase n=1 Tax=Rhodoligotrophos appendicifer TaxID=987056 RepID=UPI001186ACB4|nr:SDR family oxidoreductase [Rhodoligotrophos appendicifer]